MNVAESLDGASGKESRAGIHAPAGDINAAGAPSDAHGQETRRPLFRPVQVQIAGAPAFCALLGPAPTATGIRLFTETSLIGCHAHVAVLQPCGGEAISWNVRVVWTMRLPDGCYENGAAILQTSVGRTT